MTSITRRLFSLIRRMRFNRRYGSHRGTIVVDESSVTLLQYRLGDAGPVLEPKRSFGWSGVTSVSAFKRDCYVVDLICLAFRMADGTVVELNEEMEGYQELVHAMVVRYPSIPKDWWQEIAFPAFETHWKTLWSSVSQA